MANVNMITKGRERVRGKSVLLFSGGMDSVIFDKLLNPDILLYIPTGPVYEEIETHKINQLADEKFIDRDKLICVPDVLNLVSFERDDAIVPNRNAFLMLVASMYGETVYLGSVWGDRSTDKDETFYKHMKTLLDHMWQEQHWTEERKFTISSPYKSVTKTELVREYLEKGYDPEAMIVSYSCYEGKEPVCGWCKPCFRKWVSLVNNNITIPEGYYVNNPADAPWLTELLPVIEKGEWRGKEDADILNALNKSRI